MWEYNIFAKTKMKIPIKRKRWMIGLNLLFNCTMITATIVIMVYYQNITYDDNIEEDKPSASSVG